MKQLMIFLLSFCPFLHENIYPERRGAFAFATPPALRGNVFVGGPSGLKGGWVVKSRKERSERRLGAIHARIAHPGRPLGPPLLYGNRKSPKRG